MAKLILEYVVLKTLNALLGTHLESKLADVTDCVVVCSCEVLSAVVYCCVVLLPVYGPVLLFVYCPSRNISSSGLSLNKS